MYCAHVRFLVLSGGSVSRQRGGPSCQRGFTNLDKDNPVVRLSRRPGIVTPRARQFHWFAVSAQEPVNQGFDGCLRWPSGRIAAAMNCNVRSQSQTLV